MNKNILAENMRRFGTKNLTEQQLDAQPKTFEDLLRHVSDPTTESELWWPIENRRVIIGVTNRKGFEISDTSRSTSARIYIWMPRYEELHKGSSQAEPAVLAAGGNTGGFKVDTVDVAKKRIIMVPMNPKLLKLTLELKPNFRA